MPDWQERITRDTQPDMRVEHALRYRLAAPIILASKTWADLGCGNGVAAADALGGNFEGRAILVDVDEQATAAAARELGVDDASTLVANLNDPVDVERVRGRLLADDAPRTVTCFEVVEHLENFVPLVRMLTKFAEDGEATVLLSVPNDAFWAVENPFHATTWGEGSFEELRRMLPEGTKLARQVSLGGAAVVPLDADDPQSTTVDVTLHAKDAVPTHFLAVMGPNADSLDVLGAVVQTDLHEQRRWERQRDADLLFLADRNPSLERRLDEAHLEQRRNNVWFEEWRAYIHDLETRLGLPLSGAAPEELPSGEKVADRVRAELPADETPPDDAA